MLILPLAPTIEPRLALTDADIRQHFKPHVLEAGRIYELRGRVQELEIHDRGARITARTQGTQPNPYAQAISVRTNAFGIRIDGYCTCPMQRQCKHIAAVLVAAHRQERAGHPEAAVSRPAPAPRAYAPPTPNHRLDSWLSMLRDDGEDDESEEYSARIKKRILYAFTLDERHPGLPRLKIVPYSATVNVRGEPTVSSLYRLTYPNSPPGYFRPSDKVILARLARTERHNWDSSSRDEDPDDTAQRAIATGRAYWQSPQGARLTDGPSRRGVMSWRLDAEGNQVAAVDAGEGVIAYRVEKLWYVEPGTGRVGRLTTDVPRKVADWMLSAPPIPPDAVDRVRQQIAERMPKAAIPAPETPGAPEIVAGPPQPRLWLMKGALPSDPTRRHGMFHPGRGGLYDVPVVRLSFQYGPVRVPSSANPQPRTFNVGGKIYEPQRDDLAEHAAVERLRARGFGRISALAPSEYPHAYSDDFTLLDGDDHDWIGFVAHDAARLREAGWQVDIDDSFPVQVVTADSDVAAELTDGSGIDWLELHLGVMIDQERVDLVPALLRMLRMPGKFGTLSEDETATFVVPLLDGRKLALPLARIRPTLLALMELLSHGALDPSDGKIGFARHDAADLAALEDSIGLVWQGGESLRELGRQLREAGGAIPVAAVPESFHGSLRPYQAQGVSWLQFLGHAGLGGVLADDMGLGKTVQTLAHLLIEQAAGRLDKPALIVCPTSLIPNWSMEAARFAPSLKVLILHGSARKQCFDAIRTHDLVLTTYPLLTRDYEVLTAQDWHIVILDEAQMIKNPRAETTRQALRLRAGQRLCLSGTPLQNHLGELWSLFDFLAPGFLGGQKSFKTRYRTPIEKQGNMERQDQLARRVRPFLLRRTKEEVATELPPKTEITESIEMEPGQRAIYEAIRLAMHARVKAAIGEKGLARSGIIVLDALLKMRQACCDPRLLKLKTVDTAKAGSAKLDRLMELLSVLLPEGRRVLIFSQFTEMLALIEQRLRGDKIEYVLLTGDTKDRRTPVKTFQAGEVPVFLISLKAGGVGLNLTAADTVIHYDPWWNPAVEDQATDRAHRIGQTRNVFVHRMVTLGTIEEKMEVLKEKKRAVVAGVLEAERGGALQLTEADVEALFSADTAAPIAEIDRPRRGRPPKRVAA